MRQFIVVVDVYWLSESKWKHCSKKQFLNCGWGWWLMAHANVRAWIGNAYVNMQNYMKHKQRINLNLRNSKQKKWNCWRHQPHRRRQRRRLCLGLRWEQKLIEAYEAVRYNHTLHIVFGSLPALRALPVPVPPTNWNLIKTNTSNCDRYEKVLPDWRQRSAMHCVTTPFV